MGKIKHEGINKARLEWSDEERAFAKAWKNQALGTLGYLLCGQDVYQHNYSQRDAEVAATIIQWLGSPVGRNFIDQVREDYKKGESNA